MTEYENYHHDRGKTQDAAVDPQLEQWLAESEPQLTKLLQHIQSHHSKRGMHRFDCKVLILAEGAAALCVENA